MQSVNIAGMKQDQKKIIETLQRLEVMDIKQLDSQEDEKSKKLSSEILQEKESIKKDLDISNDALEILKSHATISEPFVLVGRQTMTKQSYENYEKENLQQDLSLAVELIEAEKKVKENINKISQLYAKVEAVKPWEKLNVPLDFSGTQTTSFYLANIQGQKTKQEVDKIIQAKLDEENETIYFETTVVSSLDVLTYITATCLKQDEEKFLSALRASGFVRVIFTEDVTSSKLIENSLASIQQLKQQNDDIINSQIISKSSQIDRLRLLNDYEKMRNDQVDELSNLYVSKEAFVLAGYVPKVKSEELKNVVEQNFNAYVELQDTDPNDEEVPVLLKNNGYSAPLEGVVEAYSLPGATDIDPTGIISIFYYFMFGMMLSDAGYGLLMFLATSIGLVAYKDKLETRMKNMLAMYWFCGVFTIFWGIMFGSFFGDLIGVVSKTFFGSDFKFGPMWFDPVSQPMRLLTFALIIGVVHLFTGLFIKGIQLVQQKDYKALFADVISWFGILIGSLIVLLSTEMLGNIFGYTPSMPAGILTFGKYLAIASAISIVLTNGSSPNIGAKIGQGLYALYGISSYLSDVLSYSRLLALGLATGVIASVINMMGSMVATGIGGFIGAIVFIAIMIFGHLANFAINALGAYVHTNRLQYVELFGKFYDGGGRKFSPLKMNTKYYKFKER